MIGSVDHNHKEVTIVGAGIAGLLAAYQLDKKGYQVTLLEAASKAGGLIRTDQSTYGISESGAHSVLATATVQTFAEEIGLDLSAIRGNSKSRYILRDGKLSRFPLKVGELLAALIRGYFVLADADTSPARLSLERWTARYLGKSVLQYLLTPFVRGIYGAEPKDLSVGAAFPMLAVPRGHSFFSHLFSRAIRAPFRKKTASKDLVASDKNKKMKKAMMAPTDGMGDLIAKLEQRLAERLGSRFKRNHIATELPSSPNVILAVPAYEAAKLLREADPQLSTALSATPYSPMVSVTAFVEKDSMPREIRGVGVLAPAVEGRDALGILFNSSSFPKRVLDEEKFTSYTVMMGGSAHPEWLEASDDRIRDIVTQELRDLLQVRKAPAHLVIHRWKRAIPQYGPALQDCWEAAREGWCARPGRILFGNYTGQVSLRGMIEAASAL